MTTLSVDLPEPLDRFVQEQVASGAYADAEDVVRASLRRFKTQAEEDARKLGRLKDAIQVGLDQLDRGEGVQVDDLRSLLDEIEAEVEAEFAESAA